MAEWWQFPYPKNPSPPKISLPRTLTVGDPDGPDVEAYKRAISRGGRWPWQEFNQNYSGGFANGTSGNVGHTGISGFQRQSKLADDGVIGQYTFEALRTALVPAPLNHAGEPLFDAKALDLLEQAQGGDHGGGSAEANLADYCKRCFANEPIIHYSQHRAMTHLGAQPEKGFTCDCSGHATGCYYWVHWADPNHSGYNGYGWTGTLVNNPGTGPPYKVGDLALYGTSASNTTHVVTCYLAGDANASAWASHGSEAGPYAVHLHYRDDLVCVVRPTK
jgi:hypothetical protein